MHKHVTRVASSVQFAPVYHVKRVDADVKSMSNELFHSMHLPSRSCQDNAKAFILPYVVLVKIVDEKNVELAIQLGQGIECRIHVRMLLSGVGAHPVA